MNTAPVPAVTATSDGLRTSISPAPPAMLIGPVVCAPPSVIDCAEKVDKPGVPNVTGLVASSWPVVSKVSKQATEGGGERERERDDCYVRRVNEPALNVAVQSPVATIIDHMVPSGATHVSGFDRQATTRATTDTTRNVLVWKKGTDTES